MAMNSRYSNIVGLRLFSLPKSDTGDFIGSDPQVELFWHGWFLHLGSNHLSHHVVHVNVDNALLAKGNGPHETITKCYETLLQVNCLLVPVHQLKIKTQTSNYFVLFKTAQSLNTVILL